MVTTQSFRLLGKHDIKDITCDQVDGENVVFWEDIEQVFPGVKYITNGNSVISMMRDSDRNRITPRCIKHYPGVTLDVVLPNTDNDSSSESSVGASSVSHTEGLPVSPAMTLDLEAEIVKRLVPSLTPGAPAHPRPTSSEYEVIAQAIKDGQVDPMDIVKRCLQELKSEMAKNTQLSARIAEPIETKAPHTHQSDQLPTQIQTVMARNYELYENPIPRLFVVLPVVHQLSDYPQDPFPITFRLYFLCDCGEYTMSTSSKTSHHIHFAKHEGYDIDCPDEFFQKYGSYALMILKMLKFGISVTGIAVPDLSQLVKTDNNSRTAANLKLLLDLVIRHIETTSTRNAEDAVEFPEQTESNDALESVDLRLLKAFLKIEDEDEVFGNLYRIVTAEGHVKWMCVDHYRERHQEKTTKAIHDTVEALHGSFDEALGCMKVTLSSRDEADQFNLALEDGKAVYHLNLSLDWSSTYGDLKRIRDALVKTNVSVLELNLNYKDGPESDSSNRSRRHDPIFDIMRHPSIKSVTIAGLTEDFVEQSNLLSCNDDFSNLKHLDADLSRLGWDIPGLRSLVAKAPNLTHLVLSRDYIHKPWSMYNAIAEYQTYPITFPDQPLCILPPTSASQSTIDIQDMTALLKVLGGRIETVDLDESELIEATLAAFVEATEDGSRLRELTLWEAGRKLEEQCIKHLTKIVARSELRTFEIHLEDDEERVYILESVQWKHVRDLTIGMNEESLGMNPLKAVVDGIGKLSGRVELEHFELSHNEPRRPLPIAQERLLQSLVASTSLKQLRLSVTMTAEQVSSLLKSANFSQLKYLALWCKGFNSTEVDAILDRLHHIVGLRTVILSNANITKEQTERMKVKGITLDNQILY